MDQFKYINETMYANAKKKIEDKIYEANDWAEFMSSLNKMGVVRTWWC